MGQDYYRPLTGSHTLTHTIYC